MIGASAELLASRHDLPADVKPKVDRILRQCARSAEIVRSVADLARDQTEHAQACDVARAIEDAVALRRFDLGRAGIQVSIEPPPGGPVAVRADPGRLQHVILNLLLNAEQAVTGIGEGRISVGIACGNGVAEITIADNGTGMAPDLEPFSPFSTTQPSAAGLGLTVAALLAAGAGGALDLESRPAGGTLVRLRLPLAAAAG